MSEVKRDHFGGDIRFQQRHSSRVAKRMGRDATLFERGHLGGRTVDQFLELICCASASELLAEAIGQQRSLRGEAVVFDPSTQSLLGLGPQGNSAALASFSQKLDMPVFNGDVAYP